MDSSIDDLMDNDEFNLHQDYDNIRMYHVSKIAKNSLVRIFLNDYIYETCIKTAAEFKGIKKQQFKSNALVGIVLEQYILVRQYKYFNNKQIEGVIHDYKNKIQSFLNECKLYFRNAKYEHLESGKFDIIFYKNQEELNSVFYYISGLQTNSIETIKPYAFIDQVDNFRFYKYTGKSIYFFNYEELHRLIELVFDRILTYVYSLKEVDDVELLKLLYFQNLIISFPHYISTDSGKVSSYCFQNISSIFNNYDKEIIRIHNMMYQNAKIEANVGMVELYQIPCSFKSISGRIDFLTDDSIVELKTGQVNLNDDLYQMFLYALLIRTEGNRLFTRIESFKIVYLLANVEIKYDINYILSDLNSSPYQILMGVIEIMDKN